MEHRFFPFDLKTSKTKTIRKYPSNMQTSADSVVESAESPASLTRLYIFLEHYFCQVLISWNALKNCSFFMRNLYYKIVYVPKKKLY